MSGKKAGRLSGGRITIRKPGAWLILLFLISSVLRYFLTLKTVNMPAIYIDEGLYINIARSIFCDGTVMYRAQPISYVYLLYPLTLLPLFLLPASVSLYRAAQLYNALMMSSIVFPAYLLGRQLKLNKERAFLLAALTAIIPELTISSFLTAESLYYPLMVWAFYLAAKTLGEADLKKQNGLYFLFAAFTGLLYFAKPVCVIFGACFILLDLVRRVRTKRTVWPALAALGIAAGVVALGYAAYGLCFGQTTLMNLYEKQTTDLSFASIPIILQSILYHALAFIFACGGAHMLLPIFSRKRYPAEQRDLLQVGVISLLASIISVAIVIVPFGYLGDGFMSPVHLRYLMFFVPLMLGFLLSPELTGQWKKSRGFLAVLLITTALFIFPSAFNFYRDAPGYYDAPSLVAFCTRKLSSTYGIILMACYILHAVGLFIANKKEISFDKLIKRGCAALAVFFLVNSVLCYPNRSTSVSSDFEENAADLAEYLNDEDNALIVTNNTYDNFRGFLLDTHIRQPLQMVIMDDVLLHLFQQEGIYEPFVPTVQWPNVSNNLTFDADTLVFDISTSSYVEFADGVELTAIGDYTVAKFTPGQQVLKTGIFGMNTYIMPKNKQIVFFVFDPDLRAQDTISVSFKMQCMSESAQLVFTASGKSAFTTLDSDIHEFTITLPLQDPYFKMTATADINLFEYFTVIKEATK